MAKDYSKLKRPDHAMPGFVKQALKTRGLLKAFKKRPEYQQNDYLGWIHEAKMEELKAERLQQMIEELEKGGIFMGEEYPAPEQKP